MNIVWKLMTLGVGAAAGFAAQKAVDIAWEKGFGTHLPTGDDDDLEQSLAQVVAFAAVAAIVNTLVSEGVKRGAAKAYGRRSRAK